MLRSDHPPHPLGACRVELDTGRSVAFRYASIAYAGDAPQFIYGAEDEAPEVTAMLGGAVTVRVPWARVVLIVGRDHVQ